MKNDLLMYVRMNDTLVVHVRSGDFNENKGGLSNAFLSGLDSILSHFSRVFYLGRAHQDVRFMNPKLAAKYFHDDIMSLIDRAKSKGLAASWVSQSSDFDLLIMHESTHLYVHRGGYSALGALVAKGMTYMTSEMSIYTRSKDFMHNIRIPLIMHGEVKLPLPPEHSTCCIFEQIGMFRMCVNIRQLQAAGCCIALIDGVGNHGVFIEKSLSMTDCNIHIISPLNPGNTQLRVHWWNYSHVSSDLIGKLRAIKYHCALRRFEYVTIGQVEFVQKSPTSLRFDLSNLTSTFHYHL